MRDLIIQVERTAGREVVGGCANECLESTWLSYPLATRLIVEAEGLTVDGKTYLLGLARLEEDLLEGLELLDGAIDRRLLVADVELDSLSTSHAACVGDGNGEGELLVGRHLLLVGRELTQLKGGIAQTMAKGEERLQLLLVCPAVAHVDTFLIFLVDDLMIFAPYTREGVQCMSTALLQSCVPGEG